MKRLLKIAGAATVFGFWMAASNFKAEAVEEEMVVAFISDYHGMCSPLGNDGQGPRVTQCESHKKVVDMIHKWNPAYILSGGDNVQNRGHRSEVYKAIDVKTVDRIPSGTQQVTIDATQLNGTLNLFGTSAMRDGPYLLKPDTYLGVDEGTDRWEVVKVVSVQSATQFTATFRLSHAAGALLRGNASTLFLNDIARRRFWPVMGDHDHGGGNQDFCLNGGTTLPCADTGYAASQEAWNYAFQNGKTYYTRDYGPLLTVFHIDSTGQVDGNTSDSAQARKFKTDMENCSAAWCVAIAHHSPYTTWSDTNGVPLRDWISWGKVSLVLTGHAHQ
jgi:hypothetical protein